MGIKWVLNVQNCVKKNMLHKMGNSETLKLSNFPSRMGFRVSYDTQDWVKYWLLKSSNNVSNTLIAYFPIKWVLSEFRISRSVSRNKMLLYISQRNWCKLGSETLKLSNFPPVVGFGTSFDTQYWVKY